MHFGGGGLALVHHNNAFTVTLLLFYNTWGREESIYIFWSTKVTWYTSNLYSCCDSISLPPRVCTRDKAITSVVVVVMDTKIDHQIWRSRYLHIYFKKSFYRQVYVLESDTLLSLLSIPGFISEFHSGGAKCIVANFKRPSKSKEGQSHIKYKES